jgi:hypothetical protein
MQERFAMTQSPAVADNEKELPAALSVIKRTLGFPGAMLLVTVQRAVYPGLIGSSQGAHQKI